MDITNLEYYIEVCKYRNITKAAEKLHISQSALSRRIASLEADVGMTLIDRTNGRFELTGAGRLLFEESQAIVKHQNKIMERMERLRNSNAVRVGFSQSLYMRGFIESLSRIKESMPEAEFVFVENSVNKIVSEFTEGHLDIIYTPKGEVEGLPGVEFYEVASNEVVILVPRGHRLWNNNDITLEDLQGETICVTENSKTSIKTKSGVMQEAAGILTDIREIHCSSTAEALMYACVSGYLALMGRLGVSEKDAHPDKVRLKRIEGMNLSVGDMVLAYYDDNDAACEAMKMLK